MPFGLSVDGYEKQFATNHLCHFYLTLLLLPCLIDAGDARIVNVSSFLHQKSYPEGVAFARLHSAEGYTPFGAYGSDLMPGNPTHG